MATPAGVVTPADYNFVMQAAFGGWGEVVAGQMAQQRSADPGIRNLAARMVADHTRANQELAALAAARGITAPTASDPGRQGTVAMMQQLASPAFDHAYVTQQIADHRVAMALYQSEAASTRDPALRDFAQRQLPIIQHHLESLMAVAGVAYAR
jgi:putative membrane protein